MKFYLYGGESPFSYNSILKSPYFTWGEKLIEMLLSGKKIACVEYAKEENFKHSLFGPLIRNGADYIYSDNDKNINWEKYDVVFISGGSTQRLMGALREKNFSFGLLKKDCIYIGESAGSMIVGSDFYFKDHSAEKEDELLFSKGYRALENTMILVHADNEKYSSGKVKNQVKVFSKENNLNVVELNENQEYYFEI